MGLECVNNDLLPFNMYNLYNRVIGFIENEISELSEEYDCPYAMDQTLVDTLKEALDDYSDEAADFDDAVDELRDTPTNEQDDEYEMTVVKYNKAMRELNRLNFLYDDGLPTRKIFKNLIVAAAVDNGYGEQVLPYIGYAIKFNCTTEMIDKAYNITSQALFKAADYLDEMV